MLCVKSNERAKGNERKGGKKKKDAIKLCPHLEVVRSEVSSLLACKNNQLHKRFKMIIKIKMVVMMLYDFIIV